MLRLSNKADKLYRVVTMNGWDRGDVVNEAQRKSMYLTDLIVHRFCTSPLLHIGNPCVFCGQERTQEQLDLELQEK